ncbi:hypothetical protein [Streptomyces sp. NBC_01614]|uniref:hypothetical protein n=1 Tax=Streptomyces sp. NBC_01614 TaxID=2975897 RepID=UPI0038702D25
MICGRCDKPILAGEEYEKRDIPSPSGAGATLYFHKPLCKKTPFQATQARESSRPAPHPVRPYTSATSHLPDTRQHHRRDHRAARNITLSPTDAGPRTKDPDVCRVPSAAVHESHPS